MNIFSNDTTRLSSSIISCVQPRVGERSLQKKRKRPYKKYVGKLQNGMRFISWRLKQTKTVYIPRTECARNVTENDSTDNQEHNPHEIFCIHPEVKKCSGEENSGQVDTTEIPWDSMAMKRYLENMSRSKGKCSVKYIVVSLCSSTVSSDHNHLYSQSLEGFLNKVQRPP